MLTAISQILTLKVRLDLSIYFFLFSQEEIKRGKARVLIIIVEDDSSNLVKKYLSGLRPGHLLFLGHSCRIHVLVLICF